MLLNSKQLQFGVNPMIRKLAIVLPMYFASACMEPGQLLILDEDSVFEETETQSIMRDLAVSISSIEDASVANISVVEQRHVVLNELGNIRQLAERLKRGNVINQSMSTPRAHTVINGYLDNLSTEVSRAIIDVSQPSPDFYIAGRLAGACLACHEDLWVSR